MSQHYEIDSDRCRFSLEALSNAGRVSVLPDYFVDRFVRFDSLESLIAQIRSKSKEGGGGSVRGVRQSEIKGGNAVNVGYSLARFGSSVHLVAIADALAADTLSTTFDRFPNLSLDIIKGSPGYTVAFEFQDERGPVNVMVSDPGDLAEFDGSTISEKSWNKLATSKIVAVLNWGSMKKGTSVCEKVFSFAHERGALTFLDPADVSDLASEIPLLNKRVFANALVDYLSLNDNEARIMSKRLCSYNLPIDYTIDELRKAITLIAQEVRGSVDIHARIASLSCRSGDCVVVPCHKVLQKTVTGAGDVWDAAAIVGRLLGWEPLLRLSFANAAAGLYVSSETGEAPTTEQVLAFATVHREFHSH